MSLDSAISIYSSCDKHTKLDKQQICFMNWKRENFTHSEVGAYKT